MIIMTLKTGEILLKTELCITGINYILKFNKIEIAFSICNHSS